MVSLQRGKAAVIVMGMGGTWDNMRKRDWSHGKKRLSMLGLIPTSNY